MKNRAIIYSAAAATIIILLSCLANYITTPPSWFQLSIFATGWGLAAWLIILATKEAPTHWNLGRPVSSPQMYASSRGQVDFLLFLRFFAALLVFLMHSGIVYKTSFANQLGIYSWLIFSPAWLGMEIFFTLSGYLMGKAFCVGRYKLTPVGIAEFIDLRVKRLLPLMIFVFVAVHSLASQALPLPNLGAIVLFFFNGTYGGEQGLGAFWSLSTEFQFYMIMPILFGLFAWKITSRRASLAFAIILLILSLAVRFSFLRQKV
jgi:peptidoglycan/LPS O-acetylase OafA/YrhL